MSTLIIYIPLTPLYPPKLDTARARRYAGSAASATQNQTTTELNMSTWIKLADPQSIVYLQSVLVAGLTCVSLMLVMTGLLDTSSWLFHDLRLTAEQ